MSTTKSRPRTVAHATEAQTDNAPLFGEFNEQELLDSVGGLLETLKAGKAYTLRSSTVHLPPALPPRTGAEVRAVRVKLGASQPVFAAWLNLPPRTLQSWENDQRKPSGAALKLLNVAENHPDLFLQEYSTSGASHVPSDAINMVTFEGGLKLPLGALRQVLRALDKANISSAAAKLKFFKDILGYQDSATGPRRVQRTGEELAASMHGHSELVRVAAKRVNAKVHTIRTGEFTIERHHADGTVETDHTDTIISGGDRSDATAETLHRKRGALLAAKKKPSAWRKP